MAKGKHPVAGHHGGEHEKSEIPTKPAPWQSSTSYGVLPTTAAKVTRLLSSTPAWLGGGFSCTLVFSLAAALDLSHLALLLEDLGLSM